MKMTQRNVEDFFGLSGAVVMVTGAGGQIGKALVSALLALEAKVLASDCSEKMLKEVAEQETWPKESVALGVCDIRKRSDIEEIWSQCL